MQSNRNSMAFERRLFFIQFFLFLNKLLNIISFLRFFNQAAHIQNVHPQHWCQGKISFNYFNLLFFFEIENVNNVPLR